MVQTLGLDRAVIGEKFIPDGSKPPADFDVLHAQTRETPVTDVSTSNETVIPINIKTPASESGTIETEQKFIPVIEKNVTPVVENPPSPMQEAPSVPNSTQTPVTRRDLREARERVNPWNVPTRIVSQLRALIGRANRDLRGEKLRSRKTFLLDLIWKIEDQTDKDFILEQIKVNPGLTEDEKKELEALVGIDGNTVPAQNEEPSTVSEDEIAENPAKMMSGSVDTEARWNEAVAQMDRRIAESSASADALEKNVVQQVQAGTVPVAGAPASVGTEVQKVEGMSEEEIQKRLTETEDAYVQETIRYQNELYRQKGLFRKTMSDLGFPGKQMPEPTSLREYLLAFDAKKDYFEALADRRLKMLERDEIGPLNKEESRKVDKKLMNIKESDTERVQRKINEALPKLEKGLIGKGFDTWAKQPLWKRVGVSTTLITAGGFILAPVGLAGAAIGGVGRATRAFGGGVASQYTGKKVDSILKKKAGERMEKANEEYVKVDMDRDSIIESEEKMADFLESEKSQKKRDMLIKASAMVITGAGVGVVGGVGIHEGETLLHHLHNSSDTVPGAGSHIRPDLGGNKDVSHLRTGPKTIDAIKAPAPAPLEMEPIRVELSNKGFIDTFSKLQQELAEKYPNVHQTPPEVAEILDSTPEKLAIKFGFYKPTAEFQSAFGLKGEHLSLDTSGNLVFENIKGSQTLFDAKTGAIHEYRGPMFDAKTGNVSVEDAVYPRGTSVEQHADSIKPSPQSPIENIPEPDKLTAAADGMTHTEYTRNASSGGENPEIASVATDVGIIEGNVLTDVVKEIRDDRVMSGKLFSWNGEPRAEMSDDFRVEDLALGKAPILDEYQFGKEGKEARRQYNIMFEKMAMKWPGGTVDYRLPIEYQGGRIQVLEKGDELTVLLNGKKIGTGEVTGGTVTLDYDNSLGKGSFIGVKNPYQEAFEKAKDAVNKKIGLFTTKKK